MNANELADKLANVGWDKPFTSWELLDEAATMLRQQQAEIEALKAGKIRAYDNGVEDGRKPNTNPVKELTDEEIAEIYHSENRFSPQGNFAYYGFARAILRKAQEK